MNKMFESVDCTIRTKQHKNKIYELKFVTFIMSGTRTCSETGKDV